MDNDKPNFAECCEFRNKALEIVKAVDSFVEGENTINRAADVLDAITDMKNQFVETCGYYMDIEAILQSAE